MARDQAREQDRRESADRQEHAFPRGVLVRVRKEVGRAHEEEEAGVDRKRGA